MLLVTSAVKTVLSISQNGISPITLNKQLANHLNKYTIDDSISFPFSGCFHELSYFERLLFDECSRCLRSSFSRWINFRSDLNLATVSLNV